MMLRCHISSLNESSPRDLHLFICSSQKCWKEKLKFLFIYLFSHSRETLPCSVLLQHCSSSAKVGSNQPLVLISGICSWWQLTHQRCWGREFIRGPSLAISTQQHYAFMTVPFSFPCTSAMDHIIVFFLHSPSLPVMKNTLLSLRLLGIGSREMNMSPFGVVSLRYCTSHVPGEGYHLSVAQLQGDEQGTWVQDVCWGNVLGLVPSFKYAWSIQANLLLSGLSLELVSLEASADWDILPLQKLRKCSIQVALSWTQKENSAAIPALLFFLAGRGTKFLESSAQTSTELEMRGKGRFFFSFLLLSS